MNAVIPIMIPYHSSHKPMTITEAHFLGWWILGLFIVGVASYVIGRYFRWGYLDDGMDGMFAGLMFYMIATFVALGVYLITL